MLMSLGSDKVGSNAKLFESQSVLSAEQFQVIVKLTSYDALFSNNVEFETKFGRYSK